MTADSIKRWTTSQGDQPIIKCANHGQFFGQFGGYNITNFARKEYTNLPPHYSLSVQMYILLIRSWDDEVVQVILDNEKRFEKGFPKWEGEAIKGYGTTGCEQGFIANIKDWYYQTIPYPIYLNISHSNSKVNLEITSNLGNDLITDESYAIQSLYIHVDECHSSCEQCSGPSYNQCSSCPVKSQKIGNQCKCDSGVFQNHKCVSQCTNGYSLDELTQTCEQKCPDNCSTCDHVKFLCTLCQTGYYILNGKCVNKCPFFTEEKTKLCKDSSFEKLLKPYLLYQDLINKEFSSSYIQSQGWSYNPIQSQTHKSIAYNYQTYSSQKCDELSLMGGYAAFHMENCKDCKLEKQFTNLPPHYKVIVKVQIWAGDKWEDERMNVLIDDKIVHQKKYTYKEAWTQGNSCGKFSFKASTDYFKNNQIVDNIDHTNDSLKLGFQWYLNDSSANKWAAFRELQIVLKLCHDFCSKCSNEGFGKCTDCIPSRTGLPNCDKAANGYYDNGDIIFPKCNFRCETCEQTSTKCLSCPKDSFRDLPKGCMCQDGYYELEGQEICQKCPAGCSKCSKLDLCSECESKYFLESSTNSCKPCSHPCVNCINNSLECTLCVDGINRLGTADKCACKPKYYDKENICKECNFRCEKCIDQDTNCQLCSDSNRKLLSGTCLCKDGYYEIDLDPICKKCPEGCSKCQNQDICTECASTYYLNAVNNKCEKCIYPCLECENSANNCKSCININNRKQASDKCACNDHFFDNGASCEQCSFKCGNCKENQNKCINCSDQNRIDDSQCDCKKGYFEIKDQKACAKCPTGCTQCINNSKCTECEGGFFLDSLTNLCIKCEHPCTKCINSTKNCEECVVDSNRLGVDKQCQCQIGYFDKEQKCQKCSYKCKTCFGESHICQECSHSSRQSSPDCICQIGKFDTFTAECQTCMHMCLTCGSQPDDCKTCPENSNRDINKQCKCKEGYYNESTNPVCQKCPEGCLNCTDQTQCSKCHPGYYHTPEQKCYRCKHPCTQCEENELQCIKCVAGLNRLDTSKMCKCEEGYYDDGALCQTCNSIKCKSCSNADTCIACSDNTTRDSSMNCDCKIGFFELNSQKICEKCSPKCKSCSNKSSECKQCSHKTRLDPPLCTCQDGYYDNNSDEACQECNFPCQTCISDKICKKCKGQNRELPNCKCKQGYFENNNKECEKCDSKCYLCENSPQNCIKCIQGKNRYQLKNKCDCLEGYYTIEGSNDCEKCLPQCSQCNSNKLCLKCQNRLLLPPLCSDNINGNYVIEIVYNDKTQYINGRCEPKCQKCTKSQNHCIQCSEGKNRKDISQQCVCQDGYHDNEGEQVDCIKCLQGCTKCTSQHKCLECKPETGLILNESEQNCQCQQGQKWKNSDQKCVKCYLYQGNCLFQCPNNSVVNEQTLLCEYKDESHPKNSNVVYGIGGAT